MSSSTLVKTLLHNSVADSVYKEITSRTGRYYYFIGAALDWADPLNPPLPVDSYEYEKDVRRNVILVKEIQPSDVAYVVDRYDWTANTIYDPYDDQYSDQVIGINLISGGSNYSSNVIVSLSGGGGSGATANALTANGAITSITINNKGAGYNTAPVVTITDAYGTGASANAVMGFTTLGNTTLQSAKFYVITDEFNIYKCLDNNNGARSTAKPTGVTVEPIDAADGYKWKFMGAVPIAQRNKFLSSTQFPITTALSSQFYSKGEIRSVDVLDTGNNYTYASILVQGDGYLEEDPYLIINSNIASGGAAYTNASISIEPPITSSATWSASTVYTVGQIVKYVNNYYEVIQQGTTSSTGPVHTKGSVQNGSVIFKYRGTGITANATLSAGKVVGLANLYGIVRDIIISENGSGYINTPSVTITGDGQYAAAVAALSNNTVARITVTDSGKDYINTPNVVIGTSWAANANLTVNSQVFYGPRLYTVSTAGMANTTPPTHLSGTQLLGSAAFTFAGKAATGYSRLKYGSGYSRTPSVTITGNGTGANIVLEAEKTEAVIYPIVESGKIIRTSIDNGGIGYTNSTLTVLGDGSGAKLRVNLSGGDLDTLQSTNELLSVSGAIYYIPVISNGYSYGNANVTIEGNGSGATANATIVNGRITKINILSAGQGYTYANVVITGSGNGASARAVIPPYGGHGRDAVGELFSRSLAFYSTINQEKNQGFVVTNDYRQFGIIKEIRNYQNNRFFNQSLGSGCWLVSGNINTSLFTQDSVITRVSDNASFVIINATSSSILITSLNDKVPVVGDSLREINSNTFVVTGVVSPDVDKYSGELMYIDNRLAFSTTEDQTVSFKTVFKY